MKQVIIKEEVLMEGEPLTVVLSNEEYGGIPFDISQAIKAHVNMEEKKWFEDHPAPLPKFEEQEIVKGASGWVNFFKDLLISNVKQLAP